MEEAHPNTTHYALAALQYTNVVNKLITQNVDGLHHKALADVWDESRMKQQMLELHGTLHVGLPPLPLTVRYGSYMRSRKCIAAMGTLWIAVHSKIGSQLPTRTGKRIWMSSMQPGKDQEQILTVMYAIDSAHWSCIDFRAQVVLEEGVRYETFKVPECPDCLLENKRNSIVSESAFSFTLYLT